MSLRSESPLVLRIEEVLGLSLKKVVPVALVLGALVMSAFAGDLRITLPKRTKPTPVQDLNREGVKALEHHNYERAKRLFYKAYLLDPDDPFTLNNLGYVSELAGEVQRAQRYYELSQQTESDALVDRSTNKELVGKTVAAVAGNAADNGLQVNRLNVAAIGLLEKDRAPEADVLLTRALAIDPKNAFTLNNLGYAKEREGELETALQYYSKAATSDSKDSVVVTVHRSWRGKPIREIAERNANAVQGLLNSSDTSYDRVARLNLQGVSAANRNDRRKAREYFEEAYKLKPDDAFTLNNMGYLAEMDGDRETANYFYQKAQAAEHASEKVGIATRKDAEGQQLQSVAAASNDSVDVRMQQDLAIKRAQGGGGPVVLRKRNGEAVAEPRQPKRVTRRETSDVVAIPMSHPSEPVTPENAAPENGAPQTPATEQQPQSTPKTQTEPASPQLVQPGQLEQPPNPQSSTPEPPK